MSGSAYRGRGFGTRGPPRSNGPAASGFNNPRFPHLKFNHQRPLTPRLPVPEKWVDAKLRPGFPTWQSSANVPRHSQYRGNLQFRPKGRGRGLNDHGIVRFPAPDRLRFTANLVRNPAPLAPLLEEQYAEDSSAAASQTPLLGSEEERRQKITETADKLKQTLSSITEEDLSIWDDDLPVFVNSGSEDEKSCSKGIPELRHEPPELDLTFSDFRDIGRVGSKGNKSDGFSSDTDVNDISLVTLDDDDTDRLLNRYKGSTIDGKKKLPEILVQSANDNEVSSLPAVLLEDRYVRKLSNVVHGSKKLDLRKSGRSLSDTHFKPKFADVPPISNDCTAQESNAKEVDVCGFQRGTQQSIKTAEKFIPRKQDTVQTSIKLKEISQSSVVVPPRNTSSVLPTPNDEVQLNIKYDLQSQKPLNYNESQILIEDKKIHNVVPFQPRTFNGPPRFGPRIPGPRCRWQFPPNDRFFRGNTRPLFFRNRMPLPRHHAPWVDMSLVQYSPRLPVPGHDLQYHSRLPFPLNDLPPYFDPTVPPNIRPVQSTESPPSQKRNITPNNVDTAQPPPTFQTKSKTNLKQKSNFQPLSTFDGGISTGHCPNILGPQTSVPNMMAPNLMEAPQMTDYAMPPVTSNYCQLPGINIPPHQPFIPMSFQPILPHTTAEENSLPLSVALKENPVAEDIEQKHNSSIEDGLEDMQEAMEFAKQVMNMTGEMDIDNTNIGSTCPDLPLIPSEIPVPNEDPNVQHSVSQDNSGSNPKKSRKKCDKSEKINLDIICEVETVTKKLETSVQQAMIEEHDTQIQHKSINDVPIEAEQKRPKVIFNLNSNSKIKKVFTQEGNNEEDEERLKRRIKQIQRKKSPQVEEVKEKPHQVQAATTVAPEKSNNAFSRKDNSKNSSPRIPEAIEEKSKGLKKPSKKVEAPTSESTWKNRVINRFLKMSKNDICNMVNNSSLRKFDIAMKHLVKERRTSLSLEMRNNEDEKMKEYDREEFMNQLNAMLDPSAVVGITDLPTEFIHHLSEVLQLDATPFDAEFPIMQEPDSIEPESTNKIESFASNTWKSNIPEEIATNPSKETEGIEAEESSKPKVIKNEVLYAKLTALNNLKSTNKKPNVSPSIAQQTDPPKRENHSRKFPAKDSTEKRQQLFNVADLDNILSEVNERAKTFLPKKVSSQDTRKATIEGYKPPTSTKSETRNSKNASPQIRTRAAADLDDIFSAGIARARLTSKAFRSDHARTRKSTSEDRITYRSENKFERWSRKERQDLDAFRNLTKEEWEAKYGRPMHTSVSSTSTMRRGASNSTEYLNQDSRGYASQRYTSFGSPARNLSISPSTRQVTQNFEINTERTKRWCRNFEDASELDQTETTSDSRSSSTESSSESDQGEQLDSGVTKLLKVIKEKEKIAKHQTLNEQIRDEVTAEIEKNWREKLKQKERKFRCRERRKHDRREKRKREKKKKKRKNLETGTSDETDDGPLLTQDQIKKEVVIKEEYNAVPEAKVTSTSEVVNACSGALSKTFDRVPDARRVPQNPQARSQKLAPVAANNATRVESSRKPLVSSATQQPKTKAQLKQMPESSGICQKEPIAENPVIRRAARIDSEKNLLEEGDKSDGATNERKIENTRGKINCSNRGPSNDARSTCQEVERRSSAASPVVNSPNTSLDSKTVSDKNECGKLSSTTFIYVKSKSGSKKIDIKAYQELRQLRVEGKLYDSMKDPVSSTSEIQTAQVSTVDNESRLQEPNQDKKQCLDAIEEDKPSRLRVESPSEKVARKSSNNNSFVSMQLEATLECFDNKDPILDHNAIVDSSISQKSVISKDHKASLEDPSSQQDKSLDDLRVQARSWFEFTGKKSTRMEATAKSKFENIRSEGSKEMKLKVKREQSKRKKTKKTSHKLLNLNETNQNTSQKCAETHAKTVEKKNETEAVAEVANVNTTRSEQIQSGVNSSTECVKNAKNLVSMITSDIFEAKSTMEDNGLSKTNEAIPAINDENDVPSLDSVQTKETTKEPVNSTETILQEVLENPVTKKDRGKFQEIIPKEVVENLCESVVLQDEVNTEINKIVETTVCSDICSSSVEKNKVEDKLQNSENILVEGTFQQNIPTNVKDISSNGMQQIEAKVNCVDDNCSTSIKFVEELEDFDRDEEPELIAIQQNSTKELENLQRITVESPLESTSPFKGFLKGTIDNLCAFNLSDLEINSKKFEDETQDVFTASNEIPEKCEEKIPEASDDKNNEIKISKVSRRSTENCTNKSTEIPNDLNPSVAKSKENIPKVSSIRNTDLENKKLLEEENQEIEQESFQNITVKSPLAKTVEKVATGKEEESTLKSQLTKAVEKIATEKEEETTIKFPSIKIVETVSTKKEEEKTVKFPSIKTNEKLATEKEENMIKLPPSERIIEKISTERGEENTAKFPSKKIIEKISTEKKEESTVKSRSTKAIGKVSREKEEKSTVKFPSTKTDEKVAREKEEESMLESNEITIENDKSSIIQEDRKDPLNDTAEPFIVLDGYIDDSDGKSSNKHYTVGLDPDDARGYIDKHSRKESQKESKGETIEAICIEASGRKPSNKNHEEGRKVISNTETRESMIENNSIQRTMVSIGESQSELMTNEEVVEGNPANFRGSKVSHKLQIQQICDTIVRDQGKSDSSTDETERPRNPPISEDRSKGARSMESKSSIGKVDENRETRGSSRDSPSRGSSREAGKIIIPQKRDQIGKKTPIEGATSDSRKIEKKYSESRSKSNFGKSSGPAVEAPRRLNVPTKAALKTTESRQVQNHLGRHRNDEEIDTAGSSKVRLENSEKSEDASGKKQRSRDRSVGRSGRREDSDLHGIKNKSKVIRRHQKKESREVSEKMIKGSLKADVVVLGYPRTKEGVMARMIEIDVEIHKLMTEKMTLYEMLKAEAPLEAASQHAVAINESKKSELAATAQQPQAPLALVSHLIQKIEASGGHSSKEILENASYSSEEERQGESRKSLPGSRKKKRQKIERTVRWESNNESGISNACQEPGVEKKQSGDATKSILKAFKRAGHEERKDVEKDIETEKKHALGGGKMNASKPHGRVGEAASNSEVESRTAERQEKPSIYSDDSTLDSFPQPFSAEQKKPSTGLALLEETFRKEMADTRKLKAEARRRNNKKAQLIGSEKEEMFLLSDILPRKYAWRKDSGSQDAEEANMDLQALQKLDEVINAVAENRVADLYGEQLEERPRSGNQDSSTNESHVFLSSSDENARLHDDKTDFDLRLAQRTEDDGVSSKSIEEHTIRVSIDSGINVNCLKEQINAARKGFATDSTSNDELDQQSSRDVDSSKSKEVLENILFEDTASQEALKKNNEKVGTQTSMEGSSELVPEKTIDGEIVRGETFEQESLRIMQQESLSSMLSEKNMGKTRGEDIDKTHGAKVRLEAEEGKSRTCSPPRSMTPDEESQTQKSNVDGRSENKVPKPEQEAKSKRTKESSDETLSEHNVDQLFGLRDRNKDALSRKLAKRKRSGNKNPTRRSSRNTEEFVKRMKLDVDKSPVNIEKSPEEKNVQTHRTSESTATPPVSSHEEEADNGNLKKIRGSHGKSQNNRKRNVETEMPQESSLEPTSKEAPTMLNLNAGTRIGKQDAYTMLRMNCKVRLVDCKYTILKSNVHPSVLKAFGISMINSKVRVNPGPTIDITNSSKTPSIAKDSSSSEATSSTLETAQSQPAVSAEASEDASTIDCQMVDTRVKKVQKSREIRTPKKSNNKSRKPDAETEFVSTKKQVAADNSENPRGVNVETAEEKTQRHNNLESTLSVIDAKDEVELPRTQYTVHKGPILDIKVFENTFLAASEDGRIYRYSQASNGILNIYKGHTSAVTCLYVYSANFTELNKEWMFSGSLDGTLRCYSIATGVQMRKTADVNSPIQCMDQAWGVIFIGTKSGHVSRYHIKSGVIKGESIPFSDKSVLALKATNEGPRRVLIVASRSQPITIRDAQSGLFLRTICGQRNHTVYSLMRHHNLIYCGTSSTSILVFDFTNGEQTMQYDAGVGIVCMRLYKQLLFAGCYDGNVYIFDTKDHRLVCSVPGPGNMLLSMEIIDNKIIAGSKDKRLQSWQMPVQVRALLQRIVQ